tara:strand:+ start:1187 stop:1357 length:171 start_codon:yes stop_codon:yes gene_type:complete
MTYYSKLIKNKNYFCYLTKNKKSTNKKTKKLLFKIFKVVNTYVQENSLINDYIKER